MTRLLAVVIVALLVGACGSSSTTTAPTAPIIVSLTGTVTATGAGAINGATVKMLDGPNAGQTTTTNGQGMYEFTGLTKGNTNISATADPYDQVILGVFLDGAKVLNFTFPIPACRANHTAQVGFGNRSASGITQDVIWDGSRIVTLAPGQNSPPFTVSAGIPHTLQFLVAGSGRAACSQSSPVLIECDKGGFYTCSF